MTLDKLLLDKLPAIELKVHEFLSGIVKPSELGERLTFEEIIPDEEISNMNVEVAIVYKPTLDKLFKALQLASSLCVQDKIKDDPRWEEFKELMELP